MNFGISIDKILVVLRNSFIPPHSFGYKNAKINFFEEKRDSCAVFITFVMLLRADFLHILKNIALFEIFENHQKHMQTR